VELDATKPGYVGLGVSDLAQSTLLSRHRWNISVAVRGDSCAGRTGPMSTLNQIRRHTRDCLSFLSRRQQLLSVQPALSRD
jgi:hypothetical protein